MKKGTFSLNPYATSYVPLSERAGTTDVDSVFSSDNRRNEVTFGNQPKNMSPQSQQVPAVDFSKSKEQHGDQLMTSTSQFLNELPEHEDVDLAFLQITFPGISCESLYGVYVANKCDLDAAIDMINQLEIYQSESPGKLPDTLDIGDVPDPESVIEVASQTAEAGGASTSGTSNLNS